MFSKVWDEITYPFLNFNDRTVEVLEWISNFISLCDGCNYLSMLGLQLIDIIKRGPCSQLGWTLEVPTGYMAYFEPLIYTIYLIMFVIPGQVLSGKMS